MKYLLLLALLVSTAFADEQVSSESSESSESVEQQSEIEAANVYAMNMISRMKYSMMGSGMPPPQQAIEHYSAMSDEDFPIDYSLACSNTCNCRTYCVMFWWIPCNCACPPSCDSNNNRNNNNNNQNNNNRFPPVEWQPEQPPVRPIFPRFDTTPVPIWNGRPEWINPIPPRWPDARDPHNPNNFPTHPPPTRNTTPRPWNPQPIVPPIWINPGPWNPNNPDNHLTHPPHVRPTTSNPNWWNPQPTNPPNWWNPQPTNPPNWWNPQPTNPPNWWNPQPTNPPNWWDNQPNNPNPPNWWDNQPNNPNPPNWWENQPVTTPPNNWWNQQPNVIEPPCDDSCSCVPCTVIWVCPPACSASCCASRGFNGDTVDQEGSKDAGATPQPIEAQRNMEKSNQNIPEYLKDVFTPGKI